MGFEHLDLHSPGDLQVHHPLRQPHDGADDPGLGVDFVPLFQAPEKGFLLLQALFLGRIIRK